MISHARRTAGGAFLALLAAFVVSLAAAATVSAQVPPTPTRAAVPPAATPSRTPVPSATPAPSATTTRTAAATPSPTATAAATATAGATSFPVPTGALAGKNIVVDPGHGGPDPGAVQNGLHEADVVLDMALDLRSMLQAAGARVTLTRTSDRSVAPPDAGVDADLQARVDVANSAGAQLFVSLHANAHSNRTVHGALTFYGPEDGFASGARRSPRQVAQSAQLARAIQRELVVATGEDDRGFEQANFWVLGGPRMPAVLVETGFLTNAGEASLLADAGYRRRAAQGVAAGIARYFSLADDAQFVADVTVPDGTRLPPGAAFVKTWRLRNTGTTTWGPGYRLAFHDGQQLAGPAAVPLASTSVPPGGSLDVSVPLVAPDGQASGDASGGLQGQWQLQAPDGTWFGDRVWVSVRTTTSLPTDRADPIVGPSFTYFDVTGHNLGYGFRTFYESHGGLDNFGYPRTEELTENGFTVQYFQRARFEYHPENAGTPYEVQLGLLGDAVTAPRRPFPLGSAFVSSSGHRWYPETGHGLHYGFLSYFDSHGALDVFGYPVSEELIENGFTVQYFQRARFEYHPEHAGTPYEVQLGLLGNQVLVQKGWLR